MTTVLKTPGQQIEGAGREPEHTHDVATHVHDHYHVAHVHVDGAEPEWRHQASWHTHSHDHGQVLHSHDYSRENEQEHHARRAHIHDHEHPVHPGDL